MAKKVLSEDVLQRKKEQKEFEMELRNNPINRRSNWLNFIAFFLPIWGIFAIFFDLYKYPKRSKSIFKVVIVSMSMQICFLLLCYLFLFDYIGQICLSLLG